MSISGSTQLIYIGGFHETINGGTYDGYGFQILDKSGGIDTFQIAIVVFWNLEGVWCRKKISGTMGNWTRA